MESTGSTSFNNAQNDTKKEIFPARIGKVGVGFRCLPPDYAYGQSHGREYYLEYVSYFGLGARFAYSDHIYEHDDKQDHNQILSPYLGYSSKYSLEYVFCHGKYIFPYIGIASYEGRKYKEGVENLVYKYIILESWQGYCLFLGADVRFLKYLYVSYEVRLYDRSSSFDRPYVVGLLGLGIRVP